jgi:hypothetical protein
MTFIKKGNRAKQIHRNSAQWPRILTRSSLPVSERGGIVPLQAASQERPDQIVVYLRLRRRSAEAPVEREGVRVPIRDARSNPDGFAPRQLLPLRSVVVLLAAVPNAGDDIDAAFGPGLEWEEWTDAHGHLYVCRGHSRDPA